MNTDFFTLFRNSYSITIDHEEEGGMVPVEGVSKGGKAQARGLKSGIGNREIVYFLGLWKNSNLMVKKITFDTLGFNRFKDRYLLAPSDEIVVVMSLIANHGDVSMKHRELATLWLEFWDNETDHYRYLLKRGRERSGCNADFVLMNDEGDDHLTKTWK